MADKYKMLAKNTAVLGISQFGTKVLTFLLVPFYTYVLSTSEYGDADVISTTTMLATYLFTLNIADAVLRFAIEKRENSRDIFKFAHTVIFAGTVLLSILAVGFHSLHIVNWPFYYYGFIIFGHFTNSLSTLCTNYLKAIDKVNHVAIAGFICTAAIIACNLLFLLVFKWGLAGYLLSTVIGHIVLLIYCYVNVGEKGRVNNVKCSGPLKKEMVLYAIPLIFNSLAWWVNSSLDKYFIMYYFTSSENGIYGAASKIPLILSTILSIFIQAWSLSAITEFDREDKDGFFRNTYNMFCAVLMVGCSFLVFGNVFIVMTFSKKFFDAWTCSSILLISGVFNGLGSFLGSIFSAAKNSKLSAVSTVAAAGLNTVLNFILIPRFGIQGAAVATAMSFALIWFMRMITLKKIIDLKVNHVKYVICFVLIVVQVVFERLPDHFYPGQAIILLVILLLNYKTLITAMNKVAAKYIKRGKNEQK